MPLERIAADISAMYPRWVDALAPDADFAEDARKEAL